MNASSDCQAGSHLLRSLPLFFFVVVIGLTAIFFVPQKKKKTVFNLQF